MTTKKMKKVAKNTTKKATSNYSAHGHSQRIVTTINKEDYPKVNMVMDCETRSELLEKCGITLHEDVEWPRRKGRYTDKWLAIVETMILNGEEQLKQDKNSILLGKTKQGQPISVEH